MRLVKLLVLSGLLAAWITPVTVVAAQPELVVQVVPRPTASVPLGAQRVTMLTVRFTASCSRDVRVDGLVVHHKALGDFHDIERAYGMAEGKRQTRSAPMTGPDGQANVRWFRGLVIKACQTSSLDVMADFSRSAAAAGEHAFSIDSTEDIDADAPVRIVVNPAGTPSVTIPVGAVTGTVIAEALPLPNALSYGANRTVARLRLRADSREDQSITAITFVNEGTARDADLQNLVLETSGHTVLSATYPALENDRLRITLDPPMVLRRNETRLIQLLADVRASRRKTVKLVIQEQPDIEAAPVR